MVLREAKRGDEKALAHFHVAAWKAAYRGMMPDSFLDGLDADKRAEGYTVGSPDSGASRTILAQDSETIPGFVSFGRYRGEGDAGEVFGLYAHPDIWRHGVGGTLMNEACRALSEQGYEQAHLWVLSGNSRAEKFYVADGWHVDGLHRHVELAPKWGPEGGVAVDETRYTKSLVM